MAIVHVDHIIYHIVFLKQRKGNIALKIKRNSDAIKDKRDICVFKHVIVTSSFYYSCARNIINAASCNNGSLKKLKKLIKVYTRITNGI